MKIIVIILMFVFVFLIKTNNNIEKFSENNIIHKTYFINLDKSVDRRNNLEKNSHENNIKLTRFPAYYGKDLDKQKLYKDGIFDKFIFRTKDGMIGCTLSHLKLWEKISNGNDEIVLILEDDVLFADNFWDKFNKYYSQLPADWDIAYLGASNIYGKKVSENLIKPIYGTKSLTNVGAYGMLVRKKNMDKMLKAMTPVSKDFDIQLRDNYNKNSNIYYFNPPIILHDNTIDSDRRVIDGSTPKSGYRWRNHIQGKITTLN